MLIKFSKKFEKHRAKTPKKIRQAFDNRLEMFIADRYNPTLRNHALTGKYAGHFSINITGDWRAIYRENEKIIFVAMGTHAQLYKK